MNVVMDIDHCLADAHWRDPLWASGQWDEWHAEAPRDKSVPEMARLVNALSDAGHSVVCMTGRKERWRSMTMRWLHDHRIQFDELIMRPDDDWQRTPALKVDLARKRFGEDLSELHLVFDDRDDVVAAFNALGITTLHVRIRDRPRFSAQEGAE